MKNAIIGVGFALLGGMLIAVCGWIWQTEGRLKVYDHAVEMQRTQIKGVQSTCDKLEHRMDEIRPFPRPTPGRQVEAKD